MTGKRTPYSADFKAKVALEALRGELTTAQLAAKHGVHHRHKGLNNWAENSHQPTRRRERQMKRFKSAQQVQRILSAHDQINNLFHLRHDHVSASEYRAARAQAFDVWVDISSIAAVA